MIAICGMPLNIKPFEFQNSRSAGPQFIAFQDHITESKTLPVPEINNAIFAGRNKLRYGPHPCF
mgnify:CR=1 FL=1